MADKEDRCATCRWWREAGVKWAVGRVPPRYDSDEPDPALSGWGLCQMVEEEPKPGGAVTQSLGYFEQDIGLLTAPDFGCIRWAPKGEAKK